MSGIIGSLFNQSDRLNIESLSQRLARNQVITSNVANSETPGFRAIGYNFEEQLAALANLDEPFPMKASNDKHFRYEGVENDGTLQPEVFVRPQESIGEDGNTVDVDAEMGEMAQNQILFRAAVDFINKKVGMIRYAISSGMR